MVCAWCGVPVFLGAYTIAFAQQHTPNRVTADITNSNIAFGR
jgi:hypothetical protein